KRTQFAPRDPSIAECESTSRKWRSEELVPPTTCEKKWLLIRSSTTTFNWSGDGWWNPNSGSATAIPMNRTVWSTTWNKSSGVGGCAGISTLPGCFMKVKPCEAIDLTHQFSPWGGSMENPESDTSIRCCPAPEACNPLQLNWIDMESAAHSLSCHDDSYRSLDARLRFSSPNKEVRSLRKYNELTVCGGSSRQSAVKLWIHRCIRSCQSVSRPRWERVLQGRLHTNPQEQKESSPVH